MISVLLLQVCQFANVSCGGFQALADRGYMQVDVRNAGYIASSYTVSVHLALAEKYLLQYAICNMLFCVSVSEARCCLATVSSSCGHICLCPLFLIFQSLAYNCRMQQCAECLLSGISWSQQRDVFCCKCAAAQAGWRLSRAVGPDWRTRRRRTSRPVDKYLLYHVLQVGNCTGSVAPINAQSISIASQETARVVFEVFVTSSAAISNNTCPVTLFDSQVIFFGFFVKTSADSLWGQLTSGLTSGNLLRISAGGH